MPSSNVTQEDDFVISARKDFPFFSVHPDIAYLDTASSAQKLGRVVTCLSKFLTREYANIHRGLYDLSNNATQRYEGARRFVHGFLSASEHEEIIFTKGATEAINLVASSFVAPRLKKDDVIILTCMEHHANIVPWHFLRERYGIKLLFVRLNAEKTGIDIDHYRACLKQERVKFVTLTHMSNVLGGLMPLDVLIHLAHENNIPVLVDGAQACVHHAVDIAKTKPDFYVLTGHKLYGPTGIGALCARKDHLEAMIPYQGGGEMIHEVFEDRISYTSSPHKFEAGTPPIAEAIALQEALAYILQNQDAIAMHEEALSMYVQEKFLCFQGVKTFPKISVKECNKRRTIFSFSLEGIHPHDVAMVLNQCGVCVRAGHHCAQPLMVALGQPGLVRASLGLYTTYAEIDKMFVSLEKTRHLFAV